jgi:hypothetical protein
MELGRFRVDSPLGKRTLAALDFNVSDGFILSCKIHAID